ncbi:DNA helicase RecQ [Kordiimonas marina]|uniref:DNA helicase RecQ n=1 Tax=Kordiimonas marina TaxID=2872312 RepID=UPI001FF33A91|nr:DNA helicase RecQ [Kordiimonas marina]MCJ9429433.1 DNA helicase RecQ [Kordiimonas marina]
MTLDPKQILADVFGFSAFRGRQEEVISHVLAGGSGLLVMPTGGGKSLCYQVPALCRDGVAVVVSPLIALMQDQVTSLRQLGVRAAAINSAMEFADLVAAENALRAGELDLVYVAPERLLTDRFLALLDDIKVALFAIDEAHCVSQWGHDFRPEYRQLELLATRYPAIPRLALTATADEPTRQDIVERLGLSPDDVFIAGFDRPNIRYLIAPKEQARKQVLSFIQNGHAGEAGIVYCLSRQAVEETSAWLNEQGIMSLPYHAGLDRAIRAGNQDRFLKEDAIVMVATIAFGMGIDKPDVRFVVHMDLPKSLEAYYQETGRAGRDGLPAEVFLVYGAKDMAKIRQFTENSGAPEAQKRIERQKLDALLGFCETASCRRQVLLSYFGEDEHEPCGNCDTCLNPPDVFDGTVAAQKLMSCVYRTGQMFGAGHVIDVLLGGNTERIRKFGHDMVSTYGIGEEYTRREWQSFVRQLVAQNLLTVDITGHGGLHLGAEAGPVLKGARQVMLRKDHAVAKPAKEKRKRAAIGVAETDQGLFEALRACRVALAREQGVPPYVIFHDSTLAAMAADRPRDQYGFALLPGVGGAKLERYAEPFLAVISGHSS